MILLVTYIRVCARKIAPLHVKLSQIDDKFIKNPFVFRDQEASLFMIITSAL